ncbi:MAG: GNAT family N-acetyltransferase, partial [Pseudomonadota bacterium]
MFETAQLFHETVQRATAGDYTTAQRNAWSLAPLDRDVWRARLNGQLGFVAQDGDAIVGFMTLG